MPRPESSPTYSRFGHRPDLSFEVPRVSRICRYLVNGKPCGAEFQGTRVQKFCPAHSKRIKLTGRSE